MKTIGAVIVVLALGLAACGGHSGASADAVKDAVQAYVVPGATVQRCDQVEGSTWWCTGTRVNLQGAVTGGGGACYEVTTRGDAVAVKAKAALELEECSEDAQTLG